MTCVLAAAVKNTNSAAAEKRKDICKEMSFYVRIGTDPSGTVWL